MAEDERGQNVKSALFHTSKESSKLSKSHNYATQDPQPKPKKTRKVPMLNQVLETVPAKTQKIFSYKDL